MTVRVHRWRGATSLLVALVVSVIALAGIALAGCSKRSESGPTAGTPNQPADGRSDQGGGFVAEPGAPTEGAKEGGGQAPISAEPRSLIYTGSISVRVDDVVKAADRATDIVVGSGGLVGADRRTLDAARSEATLTLRVPADKFSSTLDQLAKLGTEESRAIQTQDVTEAIVDLDARLATQRASVERVRALLAKAQTIGEVVTIEGELTRREAELASLEQRKDRLADQVALSTITLNLRGPEAPGPVEEKPGTGFVAGLKDGWAAFLESVKIVLTVAGYLLPWLIAIGVPIWLLVWLLRRPRRVAAPPTPPAA